MPGETPKIETAEVKDSAVLEEKAKRQAGLILKLIQEFKDNYEKEELRRARESFEGIFQSFRSEEKKPFLKDFEESKMGKTGEVRTKVQSANEEPKEISLSEALVIMNKVEEEIRVKCREFGWDEEELKEKSWP